VAEEKQVTLRAEGDDVVATGDRDRLRQVFANLIDNAIKYSERGSVVTIATRRQDDVAVVTVTDTGIGIAPEELPRIWERLYRGDRSRTERGLGLGLSLVRAYVRAHNGTISASSLPGQGTTFTINLPLSA
jgi:signal transduction histidine kinase